MMIMAKNNEKSNTPPAVSALRRCEISNGAFASARSLVLGEGIMWEGIGALSEKSLHKIIKLYFEPRREMHEISYLGSVTDIKNEGGIIEVQTRGYEKLLPRLKKFLPTDKVTVICPLAYVKYMRWLNTETGEMSERRKSPKSEGVYDALRLLFGIREVIPDNNLEIRLLFLEVDDFRSLNGCGKDKKKRSTRIERLPNKIMYDVCLHSLEDYVSLVPDSLGDSFTVADFSKAIKRTTRFTFYVLKALESIGAIYESGKIGRARAYSRKVEKAE